MPAGRWTAVRYADDFVTGFEFEDDVERFLVGVKVRSAKFALDLPARILG
ncbi:hypothetical protein HNR46_003669 [Haloferula luteola]|uniref:Uncharacterized protein n=1 Tax=Haloferula luteola TaxID=595692 RepID=A0A840V612_9BACT|nr:hypothetical protein [Haloferula luteola]MBB5353412.1 hypothetical protein [Haloferula luteola]